MRKITNIGVPTKIEKTDFHNLVTVDVDGVKSEVLSSSAIGRDRVPVNIEELRRARRIGCDYVRLESNDIDVLIPMDEFIQLLFDEQVEVVSTTSKPFYAVHPMEVVGHSGWEYEVEAPPRVVLSEKDEVPFGETDRPMTHLAVLLGASPTDHYNPTAKRLINTLRASGYKRLSIDISSNMFGLE